MAAGRSEPVGDIFDAYGVHVYWNYYDTGRLEYRLRDTAELTERRLANALKKPAT